jgi:hypothetical protein
MSVRVAVIVGCVLSFGMARWSVAQEPRGHGNRGAQGNDVRYVLYDHNDDHHHGHHISWQEAEHIVRRAYREILGREADRSGLHQYTRSMVEDGWSEEDVRRSLRSSDEYRRKHGHDHRH